MHDPTFPIRRAAPEDCHALCDLIQDDDEHWGFHVPILCTPQWWHMRLMRNENNGISAVVEIEGQIAGYVEVFVDQLSYARRNVGSVALCVHRDFRRRGIGRALLGRAVKWSEAVFGLVRLELCVWSDHAAAIALYQAAGFAIEGRHPAFGFRAGVHADALTMGMLLRDLATSQDRTTGIGMAVARPPRSPVNNSRETCSPPPKSTPLPAIAE